MDEVTSLFPPLQVRQIISDFAVFIAVVVWVVVDVLARVDTPKLDVPNVFEHGVYTDRTTRNGSFLINPLGVCVCVCDHWEWILPYQPSRCVCARACVRACVCVCACMRVKNT